jgi:hypothetical protein
MRGRVRANPRHIERAALVATSQHEEDRVHQRAVFDARAAARQWVGLSWRQERLDMHAERVR